ncbi:MFS transporter [Streptomyces sp. NPDC048109]|uniref:MFS transporter n=1 Tax=Streptomyces sp. NPDC048109 TaxID=3155482 RepID=UPI00343EE35C
MTPPTGYLTILRTRGVPRGLLAGFTSRLSGGIVPFATVVACSQAYGGFTTSGIASAAFMLSGALLAPTRGRLVDRHGWPALLAGASCHALFLTLAALAIGRYPAWVALPLLAAGGAISAPVTSSVRTLWSRLVPDKQSLQQAHALDSILEEITFVITPLITVAATTMFPARACIALGSWCPLLGVALLYKRIARAPSGSSPASSVTASPSPRRASTRRSLILTRDGQGVITPLIVLGLVGGSLNVVLPATAAQHGHITSAGYLFALFSVGGVIGGLTYGKIRWSQPLRLRYTAAGTVLAAATCLLAPALGTPAALLAILLVGLPLTPMFVIGYLLVDERLSHRQTEANAWLGSGYDIGSATGAAACGWLLTQTTPLPITLGLALVAALAAVCALRLTPQPVPEKTTAVPSTVATE